MGGGGGGGGRSISAGGAFGFWRKEAEGKEEGGGRVRLAALSDQSQEPAVCPS